MATSDQEMGHFEGMVHCQGGEADVQCWKSTWQKEAAAIENQSATRGDLAGVGQG